MLWNLELIYLLLWNALEGFCCGNTGRGSEELNCFTMMIPRLMEMVNFFGKF